MAPPLFVETSIQMSPKWQVDKGYVIQPLFVEGIEKETFFGF